MKHQSKYVLAIDLGTSGPKTALISIYGEVLDNEFQATPIILLPDGGAEQDQGKVGDEEQRGMHRGILWPAGRLPKRGKPRARLTLPGKPEILVNMRKNK